MIFKFIILLFISLWLTVGLFFTVYGIIKIIKSSRKN